MKSFSSLSTLFLLCSMAKAQFNNAPTIAPSAFTDGSSLVPTLTSVPASSLVPSSPQSSGGSDFTSSVPSFRGGTGGGGGGTGSGFGNIKSDKCEDNQACAALGITGLCCPTTSKQFLYCCGGMPEETCERNERCNALGLTGSCCPTMGNRRLDLNGIYLDCCDSVPDSCASSNSSKNGTSSNGTDTTPGTNGTEPLGGQTNGTTTEPSTGTNETQVPTLEPSNNATGCQQMNSAEFQKELASVSSSRSEFVWGSTVALILSSGASLLMLG